MRRRKDDIEDRIYLRVSFCAEKVELENVRSVLIKHIGKVWEYGSGTAKDSNAGWFEVRPRASTREHVVDLLRKYDLLDRVEECYPISRGYGKVQARQMDLFQLG